MPSLKKDDTSAGLDYTRTLQVAVTGLLWSGPITHFWYSLLEKIYGFLAQFLRIQNAAIGLLVKLFLDAILFSPTVVVGYFTVRSILEGTGLAGAKEKLSTKFKPTLIGAWKFWPPVNSINFYFVPLQFRVLYMNVLSLLWSGYLTFVNSAKGPKTEKI
jgi:protein Mpv17